MTDSQRLDLYRRLRRGETSRNRQFERFSHGEGQRVWAGYRRLRSLLADLQRPGARVRARWAGNPGGLQVAVEAATLRYRRVVRLEPWEVEALRAELGRFPSLEIPPLPGPGR